MRAACLLAAIVSGCATNQGRFVERPTIEVRRASGQSDFDWQITQITTMQSCELVSRAEIESLKAKVRNRAVSMIPGASETELLERSAGVASRAKKLKKGDPDCGAASAQWRSISANFNGPGESWPTLPQAEATYTLDSFDRDERVLAHAASCRFAPIPRILAIERAMRDLVVLLLPAHAKFDLLMRGISIIQATPPATPDDCNKAKKRWGDLVGLYGGAPAPQPRARPRQQTPNIEPDDADFGTPKEPAPVPKPQKQFAPLPAEIDT